MPIPGISASVAELAAYNEQATASFKSSMAKCVGCGRTFEADRLVVHIRSCAKAQQALQSSKKVIESENKPRMLVCYCCGREFGLSSLGIHVPQCLRKRDVEQDEVSAEARTAVGATPALPIPGANASAVEIEAYNEQAMSSYKSSMSKCARCGRTFEAARLVVHLRSCAKAQQGSEATSNTASVECEKKPRMLVCYCCGREFGVSSLSIHVPQCLKKREAEQCDVPANARTTVGAQPSLPIPGVKASASELAAYNEQATDSYKASMAKCVGCGRTFEADRLVVHLRSCSKAQQAGSSSADSSEHEKRRRLLVCYSCGREVGVSSLNIHLPQCLKKRGVEQGDVPPEARTVVGAAPALGIPGVSASAAELAAYNEQATASYRSSMAKCVGCGRTFEADRLVVHLRSCSKAQDAQTTSSVGTTESETKPRTLVCYCCGREFGMSSLSIHLPQCLKKREVEQRDVPAEAQTSVGVSPTVAIPGVNASPAEVVAYNEQATASYKSSMAQCVGCRRTFEAVRLVVHLRSCTKAQQVAATQTQAPRNTGMDAEKKPRMLVCYCCGREFGVASLGIHIPQCLKKREVEQGDVPSEAQTALGAAPRVVPGVDASAADLAEYNEQATASYMSSMAKCVGCARTFEAARLVVHLRSCPKAQQQAPQPPSSTRRPATEKKPRMLVCYCCGREFGVASLSIHVPQCLQKREMEQRDVPPDLRTPVASPPSLAIPGPDASAVELAEYNEQATESYRSSMAKCVGCGRTFEADRLVVHLRSCSKAQQAGQASSSTESNENDKKPRMLVCYCCGRQFGVSSLSIHLPQCLKKREVDQRDVSAEARTAVARLPLLAIPGVNASAVELAAYNEEATASHMSSMAKCVGCGRTFEADRLVVHFRSCAKAQQISQATHSTSSSHTETKPRVLVCYCCGREFGMSSLSIHLLQCLNKRKVEQRGVPAEARTDVGTPPTVAMPGATASAAELVAYNEQATASYRSSMAKCVGCGRTFEPDRLVLHLRSCAKTSIPAS